MLNFRPEFFTAVRPGTAMDMVTWLPGFTFDDTRDLRGIEGSTGNVLIDGKPPTSKTDSLGAVLRRIPASQVERVDIIVGGAPGIDMRGRNVIANVILKSGATTRRVVTAGVYFDARGRIAPNFEASTSEKHDGQVIEASVSVERAIPASPGDGYGPWVRRDGAGAILFEAEDRFFQHGLIAIGSAAYERPFAAGKLRVNGSARRIAVPDDEKAVLKPGPGVYTYRQHSANDRGELGVRYERTFGRTTLETQVLERLGRVKFDDDSRRPPAPATFSIRQHTEESVARTLLRFKRDDRLTVEAFAEGALNSSTNNNAATSNGAPVALPSAHVRVSERRGETGTTVSWKPNGRFSLDAALKLEASTLTAKGDVALTRSFLYAKPKLQLAWSPDKDNQFRIRLEHEVGQVAFGNFVSFNEYYSGQTRVGNANLRPQRALVAEAVYQRRFWAGGDLTLTARFKALRDIVEVAPIATPQGLFGVITNIGDGRQVELAVNLTLPLKNLGLDGAMLKASLTRTEPWIVDPTTGQTRGASGLSKVKGELHFAQDLPKWKVNWGVDFFYGSGFTLYRPFGNETVGAWPATVAFVEYRIKPALVLRLQDILSPELPHRVEVFSGLRNVAPLLYADEKRLANGHMIMVRLRQTFE